MRRLVVENKIFHYKLDRHYLIPTKAMEAYTKSNGKASWQEQAENVGKYETRIIDMYILSLPREKFENATISDTCIECGAICWHGKNTEDCIKTFPEDYKVYCYRCALDFDKFENEKTKPN